MAFSSSFSTDRVKWAAAAFEFKKNIRVAQPRGEVFSSGEQSALSSIGAYLDAWLKHPGQENSGEVRLALYQALEEVNQQKMCSKAFADFKEAFLIFAKMSGLELADPQPHASRGQPALALKKLFADQEGKFHAEPISMPPVESAAGQDGLPFYCVTKDDNKTAEKLREYTAEPCGQLAVK